MASSVDADTFRGVMRRVPSPVVVVTARAGDAEGGITIGSFTSVSLDPALICFNVQTEASMHDVLMACERFAVHILGDDQAFLSNQFATPGLTVEEQFEPVPHQRDAFGTRIIDDVAGVLHCEPYKSMEAADHTIIVGKVVDVDPHPEDRGAVLYYASSYRGVGSELPSTQLSPVKRVSSESS